MIIAEFQNEYRFLSNFWPVPGGVTLVGSKVKFPTVEHAYQAAKTTDRRVWHTIAELRTSGDAKRYGKKLVLRSDWEHIKLQVMNHLIRQKFAVQPLHEQLLETGEAELIEGNSWNDTFWGVCRGVGENHLGKILMQVRTELRAGGQ